MITEKWIDVDFNQPFFKNTETNTKVEISNLGKVKKNGELITPRRSGNYLIVEVAMGWDPIKKRGKARRFFIHRMVAFYFVDNPDQEDHITFLDENQQNCVCTNLMWIPKSETARLAMKVAKRKGTYNKYTNAKINEQKANIIRERVAKGIKYKRLAKQFNISEMQVSRIVHGLNWGAGEL